MAMQCRAARGDKGNSPVGLQAAFTRINSPQPIAWRDFGSGPDRPGLGPRRQRIHERRRLGVEVKHIQRHAGITTILVTHDQEEAL